MANIGLEVLCLVVVVFISTLYFTNMQYNRRTSMFGIYSPMLIFSLINIAIETIVAYILAHRQGVPPIFLVILMEVYFNSLLCVLFTAFKFIKWLVNYDVPQHKKIGRWADYCVIVLMTLIEIPPLACLRINGDEITFTNAVSLSYYCLIIFELFTAFIYLSRRNYTNSKARKIIVRAYVCQTVCIVLQAFYPHLFVTGIGILFIILSFYMAIENEDVKLIERLSIEKENADRANSAKSDFIANVSHEIRTPINAVLGMDEMILRETTEDNIKQYAFDIKSAAQTLHGIINEVLDLSKMESGKMEILPVNYNMRSLLNDTINMIQLKADAKNLEFIVEASPEIPAGYVGDEIRIKQILTNILSNAVKYTEKGSITLKLSGKRENSKNERLTFKVSDTGIGMKPDEVAKISQEYTRFNEIKNRGVEGTGLGMPITLQLLEMMNSKMNIESEYMHGTTMSFDIMQPIWDESELGDFRNEAYSMTENYVYEKSFVAPTTKVLVVDDNAINRKVFKGLLKETKLDIDEASSGAECINMVRKNVYDIIFMDHMMPEMDGIETFKKLKTMEDNLSSNASVIMLTANAVGGAKEMYLEEGFDDFIAKPIVPEELEVVIRKYL